MCYIAKNVKHTFRLLANEMHTLTGLYHYMLCADSRQQVQTMK